ncbi:nucleoside diphosphate kinase regulator [Crenobacter sp. SG2305]|uniref:nucleoside diphosphate kinase regulator n=1 Tax=Crenobacter oryzisoli TaxID=3056844 RepID=UPI0025AA4211|nr:nucleoside diphosphate kinase regulator [Crenobacter sp. SG2305]MDN0081984.1 nucleoside diphosphate kinase regulator [Crenobacter sp. SG2305]
MLTLPPITVSSLDYDRLSALIESMSARDVPGVVSLERELERAEIVEPDSMPADVVTMNSRVLVCDATSGEERELTLVYPREADFEQGRLSILAPVGSALLGLSIGQSIVWPLPDGKETRLTVLAIHYQPEAAGDLHR